ncbi:MAG TPA: hypothetical protein VG917_04670 [Patescibacteria group bacterium]|nr:hypothetical protein [Patescibacteria group bacterium]
MATEKLNYRDLLYDTDPTIPRVGKIVWAGHFFEHKRRAFKEAERAKRRERIKQEEMEQETALTRGNLRLLKDPSQTQVTADTTHANSKNVTNRTRSFENSVQTICESHVNEVKIDRIDRDQIGWAAMTSHYYGPGIVELSQLPNGRPFGEFDLTDKPITLVAPGMNSSVHGKQMTYEK